MIVIPEFLHCSIHSFNSSDDAEVFRYGHEDNPHTHTTLSLSLSNGITFARPCESGQKNGVSVCVCMHCEVRTTFTKIRTWGERKAVDHGVSSVRKVKAHVRGSFERGVNFTPLLRTSHLPRVIMKFIPRSQKFGREVNAWGWIMGCQVFGK